jgi:hypothetical protein
MKHYRKQTAYARSPIKANSTSTTTITVSPKVIQSNTPPIVGSGTAFQNYNYVEIIAQTMSDAQDQHAFCVDTGSGISSMDKALFALHYPNAIVQQTPEPIKIHGIGNQVHTSTDFSVLIFLLPGQRHNAMLIESYLATITREFHLVDSVPCNAIIGNSILHPEGCKVMCPHATRVIQRSPCQHGDLNE